MYEGDGYERLPSPFPDITETVGAGIISVFPNVRRDFEACPGVKLTPDPIALPVPEHVLGILTHSEIFKQAYFVSDRDWVEEEELRFRPDIELTLADEMGTVSWEPVHNTLTEFCDSYDVFVERILGRKDLLGLRRSFENAL